MNNMLDYRNFRGRKNVNSKNLDRENLSTICGMVGIIRTLTFSESAGVKEPQAKEAT